MDATGRWLVRGSVLRNKFYFLGSLNEEIDCLGIVKVGRREYRRNNCFGVKSLALDIALT